jgi:hypothetical protein
MKLETAKSIKEFYAQPLDAVLLNVRIDERKNQADLAAARLCVWLLTLLRTA